MRPGALPRPACNRAPQASSVVGARHEITVPILPATPVARKTPGGRPGPTRQYSKVEWLISDFAYWLGRRNSPAEEFSHRELGARRTRPIRPSFTDSRM